MIAVIFEMLQQPSQVLFWNDEIYMYDYEQCITVKKHFMIFIKYFF